MNTFDPANYPIEIPSLIIAGDFSAWKRQHSEYDNTLFSLSYACRKEGNTQNPIMIQAVVGDTPTEYLIELPSLTTLDYEIGLYHYQEFITRVADSERIVKSVGQFSVVSNNVVNAIDPRSHAKKVLDAIEKVLEGRSLDAIEKYSIAGRNIEKIPLPELLNFRNSYKAEYRSEQIAAGNVKRQKIKIRLP